MNTQKFVDRCSSAAQIPLGFCRKVASSVLELKERLVLQYEAALPGNLSQIRQAIEEATLEAWETPFPHLFLPDLAELRIQKLAPAYVLARAA